MQEHLDSAESGARKAGSTTSPTASSSPFRWRSRPCRSGLFIGFFVALAKQSERTVAAAGRQHLHDDLPRPAGTADAVPRLLRRADRAAERSCTVFQPGRDGRGQQLRLRHDRARRGVLVLCQRGVPVRLPAIPHGQYEGGYSIGLTKRPDDAAGRPAAADPHRPARPGQSLADPAEGYRAGFGHRPAGHHCARPSIAARVDPGGFPVLRARHR